MFCSYILHARPELQLFDGIMTIASQQLYSKFEKKLIQLLDVENLWIKLAKNWKFSLNHILIFLSQIAEAKV